ncbi:MAG: FHA domain-containing serine/threonine-protein kinase [Planctomycetota bacterium]|jgi:serine/threonine protein kinase
MEYSISVVSGPDSGRNFTIRSGEALVIGRGQQTETRLQDPSVSRQHCEITFSAGALRVRDLDSGTGTFLNQVETREADLRAGDRISIGDTDLQVDTAGGIDSPTIAPTRSTAPPVRNLASLKGQVLHHYEIIDEVARGKAGTVFRARRQDREGIVALKVLWPDIAQNSDERRRFVRAMKTMQPIRHPNIVRILNAGITELDGRSEPHCWFAMEYVDGFNLEQLTKNVGTAGMLDWQHAFRVAVHVGRALEVAHEHGIVHRGISPENILIPRAERIAKLGDLMLAKALDGTSGDQITRRGELVGEIPFMSPERTRGEDIDHRSDLYSLGATLFTVITGQTPFDAPSAAAMIQQIQQGEPLRPRTFQLSINDMFEGVVMKLLERRPADRYQTPSELLSDLERVGRFAGLKPV